MTIMRKNNFMINIDCCANCHHCIEVYDNSEFCYYYCIHENYCLESLNSWCDSFMKVNPKLLYKRPILPIAIGK